MIASRHRRAEMLIIVPRDGAILYEGLKARQEAKGQDRVVLDRRAADRRGTATLKWKPERRNDERRAPVSDADRALLKVLGFMVRHPDDERTQQAVTARELPLSIRTPPSRDPRVGLIETRDQLIASAADPAVIRVVNERRRWVVRLDGRDTLRFSPRGRGRAVLAALDLAGTIAPALVVVHTADGRVRQTICVGPSMDVGRDRTRAAH
jgi:hypothetical protein